MCGLQVKDLVPGKKYKVHGTEMTFVSDTRVFGNKNLTSIMFVREGGYCPYTASEIDTGALKVEAIPEVTYKYANAYEDAEVGGWYSTKSTALRNRNRRPTAGIWVMTLHDGRPIGIQLEKDEQ